MDIVGTWLNYAVECERETIPLQGSLRVCGDCVINDVGERAEPVFLDEGSGIMGWLTLHDKT